MGTVALCTRENTHNLDVTLSSEYATQVLDKNHTGLISIKQIAKDPVLKNYFVPPSILLTNNIKVITNTLVREFGTNDSISIEKRLTTYAKSPLLL
jgi:uncharacterized protein